MIDINELALRHGVEMLSRTRQLTFILLSCERMVPALKKFGIETGFSFSHYIECLKYAWSCVDEKFNLFECDNLANECVDNAPDTEEFEHPLTSAALNAALSIGSLMSFLSDHNAHHILEIIDLARDTAALSAQNISAVRPSSLSYEEVMRHPLVLHEISQQAQDFAFVLSLPSDTYREILPIIKGYLRKIGIKAQKQ